MKKDIHPDYVECHVVCSCGNEFTTHSTKPEMRIDICNVCHPFFTGTQKLIDTGGRVQRFEDRFGSASDVVAEREAAKKAERAAKAAEREAAKKAEREAKAQAKAERAAKYAEKAASEAKAAEANADAQEAAAEEENAQAEEDTQEQVEEIAEAADQQKEEEAAGEEA